MDHLVVSRRLTRRGLLALTGVGTLALVAACAGSTPAATPVPAAPPTPAAPAATPTPVPTAQPVQIATAVPPTATPAAASASGAKNIFGKALPADAAPTSKQFTVTVGEGGHKAMDFYEAVYDRAPLADYFGIGLTHIDADFNIFPGIAEKWEVSKDGLTWTFNLRKGVMWSDDTELTANDYVQTFRYSADPKHAWDFTWYWQDVIKNYTEAAKGTMPTSQIGVRQGDSPYTLIIETVRPVPYLPAQLIYSWTMSAKALEKYNSGVYNTNPQTSVSCGPHLLEEWSPDKRVLLGPNKKYSYAQMVPYIERQVGNIVKGGSNFQRFQAGEIDSVEIFTPDIKTVQNDAKLSKYHIYVNPQDFRVYYAFFDVKTKPWDNLKVRQAFAHAVDRDAIIKAVLAPLALPVYGMLAPGFPSAVVDELKPLANYDPALAKRLLAEAGYPDGKDFPEVTFYIRGSGPATDPAVTQAMAAGWQQTLGVKIKIQNLDQPSFMAKLNAKPTEIPFGWISYGMDYFDASNMLGLFLGGGRHNWNNDQFDKLIKDANPMIDLEKRNALYADAQKLLTTEAPAIFIYNQLHGYLYHPYYKGTFLDKDKYGYDGTEWGAFPVNYGLRELYIGKEVDEYRKVSL